MTANDDDAFGAAIAKLERLAALTDDDRRAIRELPFEVRRAGAGEHLTREGDRATHCCFLLGGYLCRHKTTGEGGRQLVSFHAPGDIVDLQHLLLSIADHSIQAITAVTYAAVPTAALRQVAQARPNLADALWRDTLIDASVFREWVLNVGRRDARARVAHMLCEFAVRREAAGLGAATAAPLPLSHADIADATGLTGVHVARELALLAAAGLLARETRPVLITDWPGLLRAAEFDAGYLHASVA